MKEYAGIRNVKTEVILLGGVALHYYGMIHRATLDVNAEIKGEINPLKNFLKSKGVPADLGEDISRWSLISLPAGYRRRAVTIYKDKKTTLKVLSPLDLVIAKLRRFTEQDITDALFVANKFKISAAQIEKAKNSALKSSPQDTALSIFEKNVVYFIQQI